MLSGKIYYVNSVNRLTGTNGHFSYKFNIPSGSNFDRVVMLQANIPISYYLVPLEYNTFLLTENGTTVTVTIPPGNYNVLSFRTLLVKLLNDASPNGIQYDMAFSNTTGKFTWTSTSTVWQPSFTFIKESLFEQFGFPENSTQTFVSGFLTSLNVVSFLNESSLFIHSDIVEAEGDDILQEIFNNNSAPFSNATYQCNDTLGYAKRLRTNQSNIYHFSITDEDGRQINLNGVNCVFTILLFKKDNLSKLIRDYMKLNLSE